MKLNDIAYFVEDKISSENIKLDQYVTTDSLLQNKKGRTFAQNLPPQKCSLVHFKKGDVLLGNIRPYLKKIWYANIEGGCSQDVLVLRAKNNLESKFLYALLIQDSFFDYEMKATKGSKMPRGDKSHIINFPCLDLNNKTEIGKLLSSLDDKIALNNRINAKLEQMAKRLYDYWFVQFDFPVSCHSELVSDSHSEEMLNQVQHDERIKPYKSTGGKMVWNEELKREIPEGWEVKSINDISVSYRGVGYTADDEKSETDENVVLILRGNNISNNHIVFDSNTVYLDKTFVSPDQEIHKFDLVMTMSSGSKEHVGKSAMFLYDSSHSYGAFCNKITPNKDCQYFLENYLHSEYFKKYIKVTCSGTGINNLTNEHFDKAKFAFPDDEVLNAFNEKMKAIYEKRGVLEQENLKLTSMRDKLLPLLMNGQIVVE